MQSQSITAYGAPLTAVETADPRPRGREVILQVHCCGVCHTDLHLQEGQFALGGGETLDIRPERTLPFTPGHEIYGRVHAVGPQAEGVYIGERRLVYPWTGCGTCPECSDGDNLRCPAPAHIGIQAPGGFASYVRVPDARFLLPAPDIDPAFASILMGAGLTAFGALKKVVREAQRGPVLIIGLGGVGLMALEFARALFNAAPLVADIRASQRAAGLKRGAKAAYDPDDPRAGEAVLADTGGLSCVVDFAGTGASFQFASSVLGKGGKLVIAGLLGGKFSMATTLFPLRDIALAGSFAGTLDDARSLIALVQSGVIRPPPIDVRPLRQANSALDDLKAGKVAGRIVLVPEAAGI